MTTPTEVGHVQMRIAKVVGLATAGDEPFYYVVLEEVAGDRQLAIAIAHAEAFGLAVRLGGIAWRRPMTYQFVAALVHALAGGSGGCGSTGWWRTPISPPWSWTARLACGRSTRGPATR